MKKEWVKQEDKTVETRIPRSSAIASPSIPTGLARHTTSIREGKISGEIFTKDPKRRMELGLPIHYADMLPLEEV